MVNKGLEQKRSIRLENVTVIVSTDAVANLYISVYIFCWYLLAFHFGRLSLLLELKLEFYVRVGA